MRKKNLFFFVIFCSSQITYSIDTNSIKFMPMHVGDYWVYNGNSYSLSSGSRNWIDKLSVLFIRNVNNHIYYYLNITNYNNTPFSKGYYRVDSTTGSLYKYDSTGSCSNYHNEILVDSLASLIGDTTNNCGIVSYFCNGISNAFIFNDSSLRISYRYYSIHPPYYSTYNRHFVKKYGFYIYSGQGSGGMSIWSSTLTLKGCKINGIIYGDTSTTGINKIGSTIPNRFSLSQNYPNPFNPSTSIRYKVESRKLIRLFVYDILGKEVAVPVNEKQTPGEYEVQFPNNALTSNQLPSGVYFYTLFADGERIDTKKMILIK